VLQHCPPLVMQSAPGVGLILFSVWGLGPSVRLIRRKVFKVIVQWEIGLAGL
jgi:MscS family membrane protein